VGRNGASDVFASKQEVIQPAPTPVSWLAAVAEFPDPLKGTVTRQVVLDGYHQLGMMRAFLEPGAARALAFALTEAAKLAENKGVQVIEGTTAAAIARGARGHG
jgi:hypothetical protein